MAATFENRKFQRPADDTSRALTRRRQGLCPHALAGLAFSVAIALAIPSTHAVSRSFNPELAARLDPVAAGRRLANYLSVLALETQTIARACGKSHVHNLEPEDLVALTIEAAAMARVPLAGTDWIPGQHGL